MTAPWRFLPLVLVAATIVYLSHQPSDDLPLPSFFLADKLAHLAAYTALGASAILALGPAGHRWPPPAVAFGIIGFCLVFGITDEIHQSFVPTRSPSAADLLADTLGGALAVIGWRLRLRFRLASRS